MTDHERAGLLSKYDRAIGYWFQRITHWADWPKDPDD